MRRLISARALLGAGCSALALLGAGCSAPSHPGAAAGSVAAWWQDPGSAPSRTAYCALLSQTLGAHTAGLTGADLVATTTAWVQAVQGVAPAAVHAAWATLGPAVIGLVSGSPSGAGTAAVSAAGRTIGTDARTGCGLTMTGLPH